MIRKLAVLSVLAFAFTGTAQAAQQTITFGSNGANSFFHNSVADHTTNWEMLRIDSSHPDYQYSGMKSLADAISVEWVAINSYLYSDAFFYASHDPSLPFTGQPFDLNDFWLASGFGAQTLAVTGFDAEGGHAYFDTISITTTAQRYEFNWEGISAFAISSSVFDDFEKHPLVSDLSAEFQGWVLGNVTITAVPEPETYAMLLAGLGIVGAMARKRRTAR
ncbi:MAG: PEP-CTERM sorting domain-containing protein [Azoarcus sp.]|jgi:hypothetical protein|nr:PEP-CTERM sorting domain-containing protein [Azoarcus sp.]